MVPIWSTKPTQLIWHRHIQNTKSIQVCPPCDPRGAGKNVGVNCLHSLCSGWCCCGFGSTAKTSEKQSNQLLAHTFVARGNQLLAPNFCCPRISKATRTTRTQETKKIKEKEKKKDKKNEEAEEKEGIVTMKLPCFICFGKIDMMHDMY